MAALRFENGTELAVSSNGQLRSLLEFLAPDDNSFAILSRSEEDYIQAHVDTSGFVVELRRGNAQEHCSCARQMSSSDPLEVKRWWQFWKSSPRQDRFELDEVASLFACFLEDGPLPPFAKWVPLRFG